MINVFYENDTDFDTSPYISNNHLVILLNIPLQQNYITSTLLFCVNLTLDLTELITSFFASNEFFTFIENILKNYATEKIIEHSLLIFINLIKFDQEFCLKFLQSKMFSIIQSICTQDIIILEYKSLLFSLILSYDLNNIESIHFLVLDEVLKDLQSRQDLIKCRAVKGLIRASEWSKFLIDPIKSKKIITYLCELLKKDNSKRLSRLTLTLIIILVQKDANLLIELATSDFLSIIPNIINKNEDCFSILTLDLYRIIIKSEIFLGFNLDFTFLLSFKNKGFTAKMRLVEFIFWMSQNKIDFFSNFNNDKKKELVFVIDDFAQSECVEACDNIADLYICTENTEFGKLLFSLLIQNEGFKIFMLENKIDSPKILYIESKMYSFYNESE